MAMQTRVRQFVRAEGLWPAGAHLLVAVSGGPDSVALLDLLQTAFALEDDLRLTVAHVHHGLRAEASEDAFFVERLAELYGLPCLQSWVDVPARVAETGESVEEAARILRYAALAELARDVAADRIVTGHTADDQAETVLMRFLRGTGVAGLAGIPPQRGVIVRPLLPIWRTEIEAYLRDRELLSCTDLSNLSLDFTRNRLRLELLPQLEAVYAPRLRVRLHHLAELARQDDAALEAIAAEVYARTCARLPDGVALVPDVTQPLAIRSRLWRHAIAEVTGGLDEIAFEHLAAIGQLQTGESAHLPGVQVLHEAGRLVFLPSAEAQRAVTIAAQPLPAPGRLCLLDAGCCVMAADTDATELGGGDIGVVDAGAVQGTLRVRGWHPGDRFCPYGAPGSRKVQDIFVDAGVPKRLRSRIPLVVDDEGIVWLAGFRIADRVKITPATSRRWRITIEWELNPWTLKRSNDAR
jgi:tRNA(Ile)-lysidine synthase